MNYANFKERNRIAATFTTVPNVQFAV